MNMGSNLLLLALLMMLGGTPAEYLNSTLHGPMKDDKVPILLRMFPGGEHHSNPEDDVGEPLFLTPLIEANKLKEARDLAKVKLPDFPDFVTNYAAFITVNPKYDSNLFFWYFEADEPKSPIVLWLQGGPGASSMFGLFVENGPYLVPKDLRLDVRGTSFAKGKYHIIYVDQPVGTGFSFTKNEKGYAKNQDDVAKDLYEFVQQFFKLFPGLKACEFYIAGEGYGVKFASLIAFKIYEMNQDKKNTRLPLTGIALGAGMVKPYQQMNYGEFLYQVGLVDENDRDELIDMNKKLLNYFYLGVWHDAIQEFEKMTSFYEEKSGLTTVYNYVYPGIPESFTYYPKYLNQPQVREAIHVGDLGYNDVSITVYQHLYDYIIEGVGAAVEELLQADFKVMIYSGQLDAIVPYPQMEEMISYMHWKGKEAYNKANREIWTIRGTVAGYARQVLNFREVMVRDTGHIVFADQPIFALDMYSRFIEGKSFGPTPLPGSNSSS